MQQTQAMDSAEFGMNTIEACTEASLYLGESIGFWIQSLAIILTACFAAWAIHSSRQMTRRKNSADVIFNSKNDDVLRAGIRTIRNLNNDPNVEIARFAYIVQPASSAVDQGVSNGGISQNYSVQDADAINYVLNYYEYVAVGIKRGIYDELILKDSSYTTFVHMYEFCKPYIDSVRRLNQRYTTWCEFECLAKKWLNNPLKNKKIT